MREHGQASSSLVIRAGTSQHNLAVDIASRTFEFTEFLVNGLKVSDVGAVYPHKVTYHASCRYLREMGLKTEADFLLSETGTLVLTSSSEKPRAVSLLPRIHLAIVRPETLRADLHHVFAESRDHHYLIFITSPSRTADIELTVTLGVHGPKNL